MPPRRPSRSPRRAKAGGRPRRAAARQAAARRLPEAVVPAAVPAPMEPAEVRRALRALLEAGAKLRPVGTARRDPSVLLRGQWAPTALVELFGNLFFVSDYFQTPQLRFFVVLVAQPGVDGRVRVIHPRIFYKDGSLSWRSASHMVSSDDDFWIGKGDVCLRREGGQEWEESSESTTDLPFELQDAMEELARRTRNVRHGAEALDLVLRNAPATRLRAYRDFTGPREEAARNPRNLIHGGRSIARIRARAGRKDPASLAFAAGYEPDFRGGVVQCSSSRSVLYGGRLRRYRILSRNRRVQYLFFAGRRQVWMLPPQALTTVLSSYGVRTVDVVVDDDLVCPAYEYHFLDDTEDPPVFYSQIPEGFAGKTAPTDPSRADASPWLDRLPVMQEFRRVVLRSRGRRAGKSKAAG